MALSEEDRVALSAYLDGELDEAVSQQIEARISLDPEVLNRSLLAMVAQQAQEIAILRAAVEQLSSRAAEPPSLVPGGSNGGVEPGR